MSLDHLRFLQMFVKTPRTVGAIAPSSRALAAEIIRQAGVKRARTVVELGGGTGGFTRSIVDQARDDALIPLHRDQSDLREDSLVALRTRLRFCRFGGARR